MLIGRALLRSAVKLDIRVVENGAKAAEYLSGEGEFAQRALHPIPRLILLDLNAPPLSGHEFLHWRAERPSLMEIPVVVLTSSSSESDISAAYQAGANAYLTKPLEHSRMQEMLVDLIRFWFTWNRTAD